MTNEKKLTIKQAKEIFWSKGYFVRQHKDSGISYYKIWKMKPARLIKEYITPQKLKKLAGKSLVKKEVQE